MNLDNFTKINPFGILIIGIILTLLVVAFIVTLRVKKRYSELLEDLENPTNKDNERFKNHVLNAIVSDYKKAAQNVFTQVNTQVIIEKNFNKDLKGFYTAERFAKSAVSLMIILGLLGTFYGLTLSIGKLVQLLSNGDAVTAFEGVDSIVSGLINSVEGMSVAFVTSLFGIASSIILTILNIVINIEETREYLMVEIEEYLDNYILFKFKKSEEYMEMSGSQNLEKSIEKFGSNMESNIGKLVSTLDTRMLASTKSIETSSEALRNSVEQFEKSINTFNDNTRDFKEFNHHLRNNVDRMNVSFADLTENLEKTVKVMKNSELND